MRKSRGKRSRDRICFFDNADSELFFVGEIIAKQSPGVFVLMAVYTQIFPVGTICRIIPGISIPVMNGQEMPVLVIKLSCTFGTDKPVNLQ